MTVPGTVEHFVTTGIVPLLRPSTDLCVLCKRTLEADRRPSQIPCGHTFCWICIAGWAGSGHPHCPSENCKIRLFASPPPDSPPMSGPKDTLSKVLWEFREALINRRVECISSDIKQDVNAAFEAAEFFVGFRRREVSLPKATFAIRIDMNLISAHLIALANIAPALASEVGKTYSSKQIEQMPRILEAVHTVFQRLTFTVTHSREEDIDVCRPLKASIVEELQRQRIDLQESGFLTDPASVSVNNRTADFDMLLEYLILVCHQSTVNTPLPPTKRRTASERVRGQSTRGEGCSLNSASQG